jgi:hypothetical protein
MNFPTIYEQVIETANYNIAVNSCPINYATTTIDKINELFNFNTELFTNEKLTRYKSVTSNLPLKELLFSSLTNQNQFNYQHTLNNSHLSNILEIPNESLGPSKIYGKYFTNRNTTNTLRLPSKEISTEEENKNLLYKKSSSSIKVSHTNYNQMTTDAIHPKKTLNQINEFEAEKELIDSERQDDNDKKKKNKNNELNFLNNSPTRHKSKSVVDKNRKNNKGVEYGLSLRRKILNTKIKDTKNTNQNAPFDLFKYNFLDHFRVEDRKIIEFSPSQKNRFFNLQKNKQKKKNNFVINLKEIIKQERKECTHRKIPSLLKENGIKIADKIKIHLKNKSEDFKDSVDKYLRIESSLYNPHYGKKKKKRNEKLYVSYKRDDKKLIKENIMVFPERNYCNENSNDTVLDDDMVIANSPSSDKSYLSQETIRNNFKLLNKNFNRYQEV